MFSISYDLICKELYMLIYLETEQEIVSSQYVLIQHGMTMYAAS